LSLQLEIPKKKTEIFEKASIIYENPQKESKISRKILLYT